MNAFDSFNASESHTVEIQFETFTLELIVIARRGLIGFDELSPTVLRQVILFPSLLAVLTDTG
jgi:hypothetical protein